MSEQEMKEAALEYITLQDQLKEVAKECKVTRERIADRKKFLLAWMEEREIEQISLRSLGINLQLRTTKRTKKPSKKDDVIAKMESALGWNSGKAAEAYSAIFETDCETCENTGLYRRNIKRRRQGEDSNGSTAGA